MDKKSNNLGRAGTIGFALGVFGFITLLVTISMFGPSIPRLIRILFGIINYPNEKKNYLCKIRCKY